MKQKKRAGREETGPGRCDAACTDMLVGLSTVLLSAGPTGHHLCVRGRTADHDGKLEIRL